ncbi:armadillo-type protein [Blastocladiella britannica]|nr:armadillo-type protein [Blastocladiella britannica]
MNVLDLPDDLHVNIARYLTLAEVVAFRSTCRTLHTSDLLLLPHPTFAALDAAINGNVDALKRARGIAKRTGEVTDGIDSFFVKLATRLVRNAMLSETVAITIRDAGFQVTNDAATADILMALATHNRPNMFPMVMAVLTGAAIGPTDLWASDDDSAFLVLRLARIYAFLKSPITMDDHPLKDIAEAIASALVERHAPKLKHHAMNSLEVVLALESDEDEEKLLIAARVIRGVLARNGYPDNAAVVAVNPLPRLVPHLRHPTEEIAQQVSWALCNLAAHSADSAEAVVNSGALPLLIEHLADRKSDVLRDQAVWTLGNVVADRPSFRNTLVELGLVERIADQVTAETVSLKDVSFPRDVVLNLAWVLKVTAYKWREEDNAKLDCLVPALIQLLQSTDDDTVSDAADGLKNLVKDTATSTCMRVVELGGPRALVALMRDMFDKDHLQAREPRIFKSALIALTCLTSGDDTLCQSVIDAGLLDIGLKLLAHPVPLVVKEFLFTLSNITAGTTDQTRAVNAVGLLPPIAELLFDQNNAERMVRAEAVWVLANASEKGDDGSHSDIMTVLQDCHHVVAMYKSLNSDLNDREVRVAAKGIVNVLKYEVANPIMFPLFKSTVQELIQAEENANETTSLDMAAGRGGSVGDTIDEIRELLGIEEPDAEETDEDAENKNPDGEDVEGKPVDADDVGEEEALSNPVPDEFVEEGEYKTEHNSENDDQDEGAAPLQPPAESRE